MAVRGIGGKAGGRAFLDAVPAFHVVTLRRRYDVVRMDFHGTGKGGGVSGGGKVIPAVVHPFPIVYPVSVAACAIGGAVGAVAAVFPVPVALPFPVRVPLGTPDAPGCGGLLRVGRQGRRGKVWVGVRCQRVRRQVLLKGDDPGDKACLCGGGAVHGYLYGQGGGFHGGVPFCPDHLGAAGRHHNVIYGVGAAVDMEGDARRIVRVYLHAAGQGNAGNDIRIHPVGVVGGLQFLLRDILIAYDSDSEC